MDSKVYFIENRHGDEKPISKVFHGAGRFLVMSDVLNVLDPEGKDIAMFAKGEWLYAEMMPGIEPATGEKPTLLEAVNMVSALLSEVRGEYYEEMEKAPRRERDWYRNRLARIRTVKEALDETYMADA